MNVKTMLAGGGAGAVTVIAGAYWAWSQVTYLLHHPAQLTTAAGVIFAGAAVVYFVCKGKGTRHAEQKAARKAAKQAQQTYTAEDVVSAWQPPSFHELPRVNPTATFVDPAVVNERLRQLRTN